MKQRTDAMLKRLLSIILILALLSSGALAEEVYTAETPLSGADEAQLSNIARASELLNGVDLGYGATFSFNTFVGERTPEKGYQKAIVYADGEVEADDGGGVCQVASTIYNAALYAEMDVTDRMEHRYLVSYVPGGLDATVYWGVQDFCFVNTTEYPIQIHASVSGGQVHISINGTDDYGHSVRLSSSVVSSSSELSFSSRLSSSDGEDSPTF